MAINLLPILLLGGAAVVVMKKKKKKKIPTSKVTPSRPSAKEDAAKEGDMCPTFFWAFDSYSGDPTQKRMHEYVVFEAFPDKNPVEKYKGYGTVVDVRGFLRGSLESLINEYPNCSFSWEGDNPDHVFPMTHAEGNVIGRIKR